MAKFHSRTVTLSAAFLIMAFTHGCGDSGSGKKTTTQAGTANQATAPGTNQTSQRAGGSMMLMPDPAPGAGDHLYHIS